MIRNLVSFTVLLLLIGSCYCSISCFGVSASANGVCSGHGTCASTDRCVCQSQWTGRGCDIYSVFGYEYIYQRTSSTFEQASVGCSSSDALLASVISQAENQIVRDLLAAWSLSNQRVWLGGKDGTPVEGLWSWVGGVPFSYANFAPGEPSDTSSQENCLAFDSSNAQWYDESCTSSRPSVCKRFSCGSKYNGAASVCSGRGTCPIPGPCACPSGYGGLDCESVSCFGLASTSPLVCTNSRGTCIAPNVCSCKSSYSGEQCQFSLCYGTPSQDSRVCSGSGTCIDTNVCVCNAGYAGAQCDLVTCGGVLASSTGLVCSGRGVCVGPNQCVCDTGYGGDNCETIQCFGESLPGIVCSGHGNCVGLDVCACDNGYSGDQCSVYSCYGISSDNLTSVCSGHGRCSSLDSCECQDGYSGTDCSMYYCGEFAYNDTSQVCSSQDHQRGSNSSTTTTSIIRGLCVAPDQCQCMQGYFGTLCQHTSCNGIDARRINETCSLGNGLCIAYNMCECNRGFSGQDCSEYECFGKGMGDSNVCSAHGSCSGPDDCDCFSDYGAPDCSVALCGASCDQSTSICSGHGTCDSGNTCHCNGGWSGSDCSIPSCYGINSTDPVACSAHGKCVFADTCECDGFMEWSGLDCSVPLCFGYEAIASNSIFLCSGHGACVGANNCSCNAGYTGIKCQYSACQGVASVQVSTVCSGRGTCVSSDTCVCNVVNGSPFVGAACEYNQCFGIVSSNSSHVCLVDPLNGTVQAGQLPPSSVTDSPCISNNVCWCDYSVSICAGAANRTMNCFGTLANQTGVVCSGHGQCIAQDVCQCNNGWTTSDCSVPVCYGLTNPSACSGSPSLGTCVAPNKCQCTMGRFGRACEYASCFGHVASDSRSCSGHGFCVGVNVCLCSEGYSGQNCQFASCNWVSASDPQVCSGHGSCDARDMCSCTQGWQGKYCEQQSYCHEMDYVSEQVERWAFGNYSSSYENFYSRLLLYNYNRIKSITEEALFAAAAATAAATVTGSQEQLSNRSGYIPCSLISVLLPPYVDTSLYCKSELDQVQVGSLLASSLVYWGRDASFINSTCHGNVTLPSVQEEQDQQWDPLPLDPIDVYASYTGVTECSLKQMYPTSICRVANFSDNQIRSSLDRFDRIQEAHDFCGRLHFELVLVRTVQYRNVTLRRYDRNMIRVHIQELDGSVQFSNAVVSPSPLYRFEHISIPFYVYYVYARKRESRIAEHGPFLAHKSLLLDTDMTHFTSYPSYSPLFVQFTRWIPLTRLLQRDHPQRGDSNRMANGYTRLTLDYAHTVLTKDNRKSNAMLALVLGSGHLIDAINITLEWIRFERESPVDASANNERPIFNVTVNGLFVSFYRCVFRDRSPIEQAENGGTAIASSFPAILVGMCMPSVHYGGSHDNNSTMLARSLSSMVSNGLATLSISHCEFHHIREHAILAHFDRNRQGIWIANDTRLTACQDDPLLSNEALLLASLRVRHVIKITNNWFHGSLRLPIYVGTPLVRFASYELLHGQLPACTCMPVDSIQITSNHISAPGPSLLVPQTQSAGMIRLYFDDRDLPSSVLFQRAMFDERTEEPFSIRLALVRDNMISNLRTEAIRVHGRFTLCRIVNNTIWYTNTARLVAPDNSRIEPPSMSFYTTDTSLLFIRNEQESAPRIAKRAISVTSNWIQSLPPCYASNSSLLACLPNAVVIEGISASNTFTLDIRNNAYTDSVYSSPADVQSYSAFVAAVRIRVSSLSELASIIVATYGATRYLTTSSTGFQREAWNYRARNQLFTGILYDVIIEDASLSSSSLFLTPSALNLERCRRVCKTTCDACVLDPTRHNNANSGFCYSVTRFDVLASSFRGCTHDRLKLFPTRYTPQPLTVLADPIIIEPLTGPSSQVAGPLNPFIAITPSPTIDYTEPLLITTFEETADHPIYLDSSNVTFVGIRFEMRSASTSSWFTNNLFSKNALSRRTRLLQFLQCQFVSTSSLKNLFEPASMTNTVVTLVMHSNYFERLSQYTTPPTVSELLFVNNVMIQMSSGVMAFNATQGFYIAHNTATGLGSSSLFSGFVYIGYSLCSSSRTRGCKLLNNTLLGTHDPDLIPRVPAPTEARYGASSLYTFNSTRLGSMGDIANISLHGTGYGVFYSNVPSMPCTPSVARDVRRALPNVRGAIQDVCCDKGLPSEYCCRDKCVEPRPSPTLGCIVDPLVDKQADDRYLYDTFETLSEAFSYCRMAPIAILYIKNYAANRDGNMAPVYTNDSASTREALTFTSAYGRRGLEIRPYDQYGTSWSFLYAANNMVASPPRTWNATLVVPYMFLDQGVTHFVLDSVRIVTSYSVLVGGGAAAGVSSAQGKSLGTLVSSFEDLDTLGITNSVIKTVPEERLPYNALSNQPVSSFLVRLRVNGTVLVSNNMFHGSTACALELEQTGTIPPLSLVWSIRNNSGTHHLSAFVRLVQVTRVLLSENSCAWYCSGVAAPSEAVFYVEFRSQSTLNPLVDAAWFVMQNNTAIMNDPVTQRQYGYPFPEAGGYTAAYWITGLSSFAGIFGRYAIETFSIKYNRASGYPVALRIVFLSLEVARLNYPVGHVVSYYDEKEDMRELAILNQNHLRGSNYDIKRGDPFIDDILGLGNACNNLCSPTFDQWCDVSVEFQASNNPLFGVTNFNTIRDAILGCTLDPLKIRLVWHNSSLTTPFYPTTVHFENVLLENMPGTSSNRDLYITGETRPLFPTRLVVLVGNHTIKGRSGSSSLFANRASIFVSNLVMEPCIESCSSNKIIGDDYHETFLYTDQSSVQFSNVKSGNGALMWLPSSSSTLLAGLPPYEGQFLALEHLDATFINLTGLVIASRISPSAPPLQRPSSKISIAYHRSSGPVSILSCTVIGSPYSAVWIHNAYSIDMRNNLVQDCGYRVLQANQSESLYPFTYRPITVVSSSSSTAVATGSVSLVQSNPVSSGTSDTSTMLANQVHACVYVDVSSLRNGQNVHSESFLVMASGNRFEGPQTSESVFVLVPSLQSPKMTRLVLRSRHDSNFTKAHLAGLPRKPVFYTALWIDLGKIPIGDSYLSGSFSSSANDTLYRTVLSKIRSNSFSNFGVGIRITDLAIPVGFNQSRSIVRGLSELNIDADSIWFQDIVASIEDVAIQGNPNEYLGLYCSSGCAQANFDFSTNLVVYMVVAMICSCIAWLFCCGGVAYLMSCVRNDRALNRKKMVKRRQKMKQIVLAAKERQDEREWRKNLLSVYASSLQVGSAASKQDELLKQKQFQSAYQYDLLMNEQDDDQVSGDGGLHS